MTTVSAIRKQIQRLEAEAERITKLEMSGAIAKIKSLMADFGVTLEHLGVTSAPVGAKRVAKKKASAKRAGAGVARYADPKSGKTWTGFGRAPAWIAGAKNRDAFLVGAIAAEPETAAPVKRAKKAVVATAAPAAATKRVAKAAKKAPKKVAVAAKKAPVAKKSTAAKKTAAAAPAEPAATKKAAAKKAAAKKAPAKKASRKNAASKAAASGAGSKPATGDGAAAAALAQ